MSISITNFHEPSSFEITRVNMTQTAITTDLENLPRPIKSIPISMDPHLIPVADDYKYHNGLKINKRRCTTIIQEPFLPSRNAPNIYMDQAEEGDISVNTQKKKKH